METMNRYVMDLYSIYVQRPDRDHNVNKQVATVNTAGLTENNLRRHSDSSYIKGANETSTRKYVAASIHSDASYNYGIQ